MKSFVCFFNEGQQLGAGCFGQVVKAEAVGIVDIESVTTVAVKMVRANAQSDALSSLIRELKILIYLGSHVNVVNLLGACTKSISKGEIKNQNIKLNIKSFYGHFFFYFAEELLVIIDYCRFGNLQTYLTQQRDTFIDQLNEFGDLPTRNEAGEMELFKKYVNNYEKIKSKPKNRSTSIFV